jgi:hypothetical protein
MVARSADHPRETAFEMSTGHVRQRLWQAINCLVGDGPIQARLAFAVDNLVSLPPPELEHLPTELRERFDAVKAHLTKHPAEKAGEGSILASARKMTSEEGVELAKEIVSIYVKLRGGI